MQHQQVPASCAATSAAAQISTLCIKQLLWLLSSLRSTLVQKANTATYVASFAGSTEQLIWISSAGQMQCLLIALPCSKARCCCKPKCCQARRCNALCHARPPATAIGPRPSPPHFARRSARSDVASVLVPPFTCQARGSAFARSDAQGV